MAAVGDDFGEVYTGQAGAEGFASEDTDESYYAQGAGSEGAPAATAGATGEGFVLYSVVMIN